MQSEEEKTDLACLQAVRDMGGFVTLESWLYSLYSKDIVLSCDEFCESFLRLAENKLIKHSISFSAFAYRITLRGRTVLRGKQIRQIESKKKVKYPCGESTFALARMNALEKWKLKQEGLLQKQIAMDFLCVWLWLFSIAVLAGGIVFAYLYQGSRGLRIGVGVAGVILYLVLGTVDAFVCESRCSYRIESFLSIACFPSYGLLILILIGLAGP